MNRHAPKLLATFAVLSMAANSYAQSESPASAPDAARQSVIGYATVAEAFDSLKAKPGVQIQITKPDSWTIVNEPGNLQWSFVPSGHYAYPAVVRRAIKVNTEGGIYIETAALCQAEKAPCDKLSEEFKELNDRIRQSIKARLQQGGPQR